MDISLFYEARGAGFPLILLHGNGECHDYFEHQIEYFSKFYRVIAPDTRGHGQSPRGGGDFSIRRFSEDLHDFMLELDIHRAHLLGFSDGGNIALEFALKHPEMVETLILNGANLNPGGVYRRVQLPIEIGFRIAGLFAKRSDKARANAEMLGLMVNEPQITPEALRALNMPVLVIAGTRDMIRRSHTKLIARSLPHAELAILSGSHFVAHENPNVFNRTVEAFLHAHAPQFAQDEEMHE